MIDILPQILINALITGSIYALASSGLALVYGVFRVLNFAHGHFIMVGAYAFYYASMHQQWGFIPSLLFMAGAAITLGALTGKIFVEPFIKHGVFLPFVTTVALGVMIESLVSIIAGVNVKSLTWERDYESLELLGAYITPIQIAIIALAIILLSSIAYIVHGTPLGRVFRASAENPLAAQALGIHASRARLSAFVIGALLAAIAGVAIGYESNLQPTMGSSYTMKAFAAMILGGLGSLWGTIAGAYLLGLIENVGIGIDFWGYSLPSGYKDAFAFVIILLMLLCAPSGIFGKRGRRI
jgi:branched-chain amino acid transport system permease protein